MVAKMDGYEEKEIADTKSDVIVEMIKKFFNDLN